MTNKEERLRIRAARYVPGERYQKEIEVTLMNLPKIRRRSMKEKILTASAVAAVLTLFLVFAAPPIVKAAQPIITKLFGNMIEQIEERQALPTDAKIEQSITEQERYSRGHSVGAKVEFEGVTITMPEMDFFPEDAYDDTQTAGRMRTRIEYSALPPFDPNWIDFTLSYGGRDYPMEIDDGIQRYREGNLHATTEEDWRGGDFSWYSNSQIAEGVPTTYMFFPVDDWKIDEVTDMVLKGEIDGERFEIPFVFDPVKAHEEAVASAPEDVKITEEMEQERKQRLEELAAKAAPVGITKRAQGYEVTISELSVIDNMLNFGWTVSGVDGKNPKMAGMEFWLNDIMVDGYNTGFGGGGAEHDLVDGTLKAVNYVPLGRDMRRLPEESLITLKVDLGDMEEMVDVAFRYNWTTGQVTLPKDEAEEKVWVAEAKALNDALYRDFPSHVTYDLKPLNLTQTRDGLTMTLVSAEIRDSYLSIEYEFDKGGIPQGMRLMDDWQKEPTLKLDGMASTPAGSYWMKELPTGNQFVPPMFFSEIDDNTRMQFSYTARMLDGKDKETYNQTFEFEFALNKASMEPVDEFLERDM